MARTLRIGCAPGPDVAALQADLNRAATLPSQLSALAPLAADGVFGPRTRARVVEFQTRNQLNPDGVVGPLTVAKLATVLGNAGGELPITQPGGGSSPPGQSKWGQPAPGGKWGSDPGATGMKESGASGAKAGASSGIKTGAGTGIKGGPSSGGKWS